MKVLNLLTAGGLGGIEILNYDFGQYSKNTQAFAFLFGTGSTYERMKRSNFEVYDLSGFRPKLSIKRFLKIIDIAKHYDIVVVHHGDPYLKLFYVWVITCLGKKGITFIHSCWEDELVLTKGKFKYILEKLLFQMAINVSKCTIFVSNAGKKSYEAAFKLKNARVIYNGIGQDKIEDGQKHNFEKSTQVKLLYVGRLEKIKGLDMLIRALSELSNDLSFHLSIVGDGTQRKSLEDMVMNYNLEKNVEFFGGQADVKPYFRDAHIFIYPSVCQEVFGISIVEAMAYGLICIANQVGGIPEIIKDEYNGYLNKTLDVNGLKDTILRAINKLNSPDSDSICKHAKETAQRFSVINTCNQLDNIYKNIEQL